MLSLMSYALSSSHSALYIFNHGFNDQRTVSLSQRPQGPSREVLRGQLQTSWLAPSLLTQEPTDFSRGESCPKRC